MGSWGQGPKLAEMPGFELGSSGSHKRSSVGEWQGEIQGGSEHSGSPRTGESQRQETLGPAGGRGHQGGEEETLGLAECAPAGQGTGTDAGEEVSLEFGRPGGEGGRGREVCVTS